MSRMENAPGHPEASVGGIEGNELYDKYMGKKREDPQLPGEVLEDLCNKYEDILKALDDRIREFSGDKWAELKSNPTLCKHMVMKSPDHQLRWAAIQLLLRHRVGADTAAFCESVAQDRNQVPKIRALALRGLYNYFQATGNLTVCILCLRVLDDETEEYTITRTAYFNMLDVLCVPSNRRPSFSQFNVRDNIDQSILEEIRARMQERENEIREKGTGPGGTKGGTKGSGTE